MDASSASSHTSFSRSRSYSPSQPDSSSGSGRARRASESRSESEAASGASATSQDDSRLRPQPASGPSRSAPELRQLHAASRRDSDDHPSEDQAYREPVVPLHRPLARQETRLRRQAGRVEARIRRLEANLESANLESAARPNTTPPGLAPQSGVPEQAALRRQQTEIGQRLADVGQRYLNLSQSYSHSQPPATASSGTDERGSSGAAVTVEIDIPAEKAQELLRLREEFFALMKQADDIDRILSGRENSDAGLQQCLSPQTQALHQALLQAEKVEAEERIGSMRKHFVNFLVGMWANLTSFGIGNTLAAYMQVWWLSALVNTLLWTLFEPSHAEARTTNVGNAGAEAYPRYQRLRARAEADRLREGLGLPIKKVIDFDLPSKHRRLNQEGRPQLKTAASILASPSNQLRTLYNKKNLTDDLTFGWYCVLLFGALMLGWRKLIWHRLGTGLLSGGLTMVTLQGARKLAHGQETATRSSNLWHLEAQYLASYSADLEAAIADPALDPGQREFFHKVLGAKQIALDKARWKSNWVSSYLYEVRLMFQGLSKSAPVDLSDIEISGRRLDLLSNLLGRLTLLMATAATNQYLAQPMQESENEVVRSWGHLLQAIALIFPTFGLRLEYPIPFRILLGLPKVLREYCWPHQVDSDSDSGSDSDLDLESDSEPDSAAPDGESTERTEASADILSSPAPTRRAAEPRSRASLANSGGSELEETVTVSASGTSPRPTRAPRPQRRSEDSAGSGSNSEV